MTLTIHGVFGRLFEKDHRLGLSSLHGIDRAQDILHIGKIRPDFKGPFEMGDRLIRLVEFLIGNADVHLYFRVFGRRLRGLQQFPEAALIVTPLL